MHGESSSSPNDNNLIVLDLRRRGTRADRFDIDLSDGSSFFIPGDQVIRFGLAVGSELSEGEVARLRATGEALEARERATLLLARRDHSREELRLKLRLRSFSEEAIRSALDHLTGLGYLNDLSFAGEWIHMRLQRHPEGRIRLIAGLRGHGLSREDAEKAVESFLDEETFTAAAIRAAGKILRRSGVTEQDLIGKLHARGFTRDEITAAVEAQKKEGNL